MNDAKPPLDFDTMKKEMGSPAPSFQGMRVIVDTHLEGDCAVLVCSPSFFKKLQEATSRSPQ